MKYLIIHQAFGQSALGMYGSLDAFDGADEKSALEMVFYRHNQDDRPDRFMRPALSSGDIVVLFDQGAFSSYRCMPIGWELHPTPIWSPQLRNLAEDTVENIRKYG